MDSLGCDFSVLQYSTYLWKVLLSYEHDSKVGLHTEPRHPHTPDLVLEEVNIRRPGKKRYEGTSYPSLDARSAYLRHTTPSVSCREGGHLFMHGTFFTHFLEGQLGAVCRYCTPRLFLPVVCVYGSSKSR
jgi:hypothetical protein